MILISDKKRVEQAFLLLTLALLLGFILSFDVAYADALISYTDYYHFDGSVITDHNGLSYIADKDGAITLRKNSITVDVIYFSITGKINGSEHKYPATDFSWEWVIYRNATNNDYILNGYNNNHSLNWTQEYHFFGDDRKLMNIKHTMLNELGAELKDVKFWHVSSISNNDAGLNAVNSIGNSEKAYALNNDALNPKSQLRIDANPDYFLNYYGIENDNRNSYREGISAESASYQQNNAAAMNSNKEILNQGEKLIINAGIGSCQALSNSSETYILSQSILNTASICFTITGNYTTFDLGGNTIDGVNYQGAAVDSKGINATIKNGIIQEFSLGIRTLNDNNTIYNVTSRNNTVGIDIGGNYNTVVSSIIEQNGWGVRVLNSIKHTLIISNAFTGNTDIGIIFIRGPYNNNITFNNITGSNYGIYFYPDNNNNTITFNNISGSTRAVLVASASNARSSSNIISNNQISSSGIELDTYTSYNTGSANCGGIIIDSGINNNVTNISCGANQNAEIQTTENLCNGTVQIITEDSNGNSLINLLVINNVSNKTTNDIGLAEYNLNNTCGQDLEFNVYCSDNTTFCSAQSAYLDFNNDFDSLSFDCSICSQDIDMQIIIDNIKANKNNNEVKVNITVINIPSTSNVNITFKVQGNNGLISREDSQLFNINSKDRFKFITQSIALAGNDFVHIYVDPDNKVPETNEKNNYALVPLFEKEINAYLNISTGYEKVDKEIENYLKLFVNNKSQNHADVTIAVGLPNKNSIINSKNSLTKANYKWWFDDRIYYNNKPLGSKPYNGLVGAFSDDYNYIFVAGNDIDGLIAAVKRLVSARELFFSNLNKDKVSVIEDTDVSGISVADLLRNPSNYPYYSKRNTQMFANVVGRILNDNNFEVAIKTVKTYNDNTTLRLKNINTDFSNDFKDAVVGNRTPVVFSGGLFSDLFGWEQNNGLARQLAQEGRDTWEIEMTGGPTTECVTCPNYQYEDLVDYYWPILIAGVEQYSGENTIQYVGHSNGCRVALDSLKNWSSTGKTNAGYYFDSSTGKYLLTDLAANPVDMFIGLGCPGALNGSSKVISKGIENGNSAIRHFENSEQLHISGRGFAERLSLPFSGVWSEESVSLNLLKFYNNLAISSEDNQPASGLSLNNFYLVAGSKSPLFYNPLNGNDGLVPLEDMIAINSTVFYNKGELKIFKVPHNEQINNKKINKYIKNKLGG